MASSFTLHELAAGVWMAEAPSTASAAVSNAALIDLGDRTLVVDTFMTGQAAEELAAESVRLTGRRPFLVVNSHWHSDHVGGNRVFADAGIIGTARMRELIADDAPPTRVEFERRAQELRKQAAAMAEAAESDPERAVASGVAALADALVSDAAGYRIVLPDVLVEERLEITGGRRAVILSSGRGHTESDLFVHLPDDDVLVAGDLVWTGVHPKTSDGFPEDWSEVLVRLSELGPYRVVSGHGPPGTQADLAAMAEYMRSVSSAMTAILAGDLAAEEAPIPAGTEDWEGPARYYAGLTALTKQ